jgi:hypothetical protein
VTPFDLRPLAIGELLDRVFSLYRRHVSTFVGIMAVPSLLNLILALSMLLIQRMHGAAFAAMSSPFPQRGARPPRIDPAEMLTYLLQVTSVSFVFVIGYWIAYMFALGAATVVVAEIYAGRDITVGGAFTRARPHLPRLLVLALFWMLTVFVPFVVLLGVGAGLAIAGREAPVLAVIAGFVVLLGMLVVLVGVVVLSLRFAVSAPVVVLESTPAWGSLKRSLSLTRGYLGRIFLVGLCAAMVAYTGMALLQMPFNIGAIVAGKVTTAGFVLDLLAAVGGTIGHTLSAPIGVIGVAVLYYDLRVRKEALDLQMMIRALDDTPGGGLSATPPPSPALPS